MKRTWTPDDDAKLIALYPISHSGKLAALIGCGSSSMLSRARFLGLKKDAAYIKNVRTNLVHGCIVRADLLKTIRPLVERVEGASVRDLVNFTGLKSTNVSSIIHHAVELGELFSAGIRQMMRYFASAEAAASGADACEQMRLEKTAGFVKRARLLRTTKAEEARDRKQLEKDIVMRHAGSAVRVDKSAPKRGPGNLSGPLIFTANTIYTICSSPAQPRLSNTAFAEY
jgi:hypothetical protein